MAALVQPAQPNSSVPRTASRIPATASYMSVPLNASDVPHYRGEEMNDAVDGYVETLAGAPRGPAVVAQNANAAAQPRLAPQADRPGQGNVAEDMERAWTWLSHTFQGLQRFIVDQPLLAIVVAVACAFFGVSRILPLGDLIGGVLATAFTGLVIYTARTEPTRTAFFEHLRHDAFHGVGASAERNRGQQILVRA